jgi:hypothetical protein
VGCATEPPKVLPTVRILSVGTYSVQKIDPAKAPALTVGQETIFAYVKDAKLVDPSTTILRAPETRFGVMYVLEGGREGENYKGRVVFKIPAPGYLTSTGDRVGTYAMDTLLTVGHLDAKGFEIGSNPEKYPAGQYTLEIYLGKQMVVQQSFELITPPN